MYPTLLILHSWFRWLVLLSLAYALWRALKGWQSKKAFTQLDDGIRHWTATIAHIQLVIGFMLYLQSPVVKFFYSRPGNAAGHTETLFFSVIHFLLMLIAVTVITIGSALAKRKTNDPEKFTTMLLWFGLGLLIIFIAIPWPFSPLAARSYLKPF